MAKNTDWNENSENTNKTPSKNFPWAVFRNTNLTFLSETVQEKGHNQSIRILVVYIRIVFLQMRNAKNSRPPANILIILRHSEILLMTV